MIANKKKFSKGLGLMVGFAVVLVIFFSPVFGGQNGLAYLDSLYNSISKGSAYYIPSLQEKVQKMEETPIDVTLQLQSDQQVAQTALLFEESGALVNRQGDALQVSGNLKAILQNTLADADAMYHNAGDKLADKYGYDHRQIMYNWWLAAKELDKQLKKQKQFQAAELVAEVEKKSVETAYNYYGIEAQSISDRWGIVIFSLVFYVIYTVWYGFAFMFIFEGWGMKLEH